MNWYAANRMLPYVNAGLFMDITDWWDAGDYDGLESVRGALTINDRQWGIPYTYYQWGVYYREDIFNELGLSEPTTFEEEIANCQVILDSGRKCYTIGTKFLWTAGGWFDYLNMRTNGFDHHMALARGELSWTEDPGVRQTFENWRTLIDMGAFIDDHQSYSWQEALPFFADGEATAYLMGNFAVAAMRDSGLTDDQIDFYQFPLIDRVTAARRGCADRHVPRAVRRAERGSGARLPGLRCLAGCADAHQQWRQSRPAAGERQFQRGC
jgi:multiple sugar transport system substrate-binding protein